MESNLRQQDLISEAYSGYSNSYIVPNKASYGQNDSIVIIFEKNPGVLLDLSSVEILHRSLMKADAAADLQTTMLAPMVPEDVFSCISIKVDNQEIVQSNQTQQGRNPICNLFQYYLCDEKPPMPQSNDLDCVTTSATHNKFDYSGAVGLYVNCNKLYSVEGMEGTGGALSLTQSQAVYQKEREFQQNNVMRYYNITVADTTNARTAAYIPKHTKGDDSAETKELYTWQSVKLSNLCPELSFGKFHMDRRLRIELQVNTAANCLASNLQVKSAVDSALAAGVQMSVTDLNIYAKFCKINPLLMQQAVQIYSQPSPMISFVQDQQQLNQLTNIRTSLNHSKILGAIIMFVQNGRTGAVADTALINYDAPKDSMKYPFYHTFYNIDYSQCYVEISGRRYKVSDINLSKKNVMSYIDAQIQCGQIFSGKQLNVTPQQYLQNKHFVFVDIDSMGVQTFDKGTIANLHLEMNDQHSTANDGAAPAAKTYTNYQCQVYYIVGATLVGNRLES